MENLKYAGSLYGISIYCKEKDLEELNMVSKRLLDEQSEYYKIKNNQLYKILKKLLWKTT